MRGVRFDADRIPMAVAILLLLASLLAGAPEAHAAGDQPPALRVEGEHYGREPLAFQLLVTQNRFVKSYSNGVTITGVRTSQGPVYHFVREEGRLIIKMSQGNLHRIGEMSTWETMTKLTRFADRAGLVREDREDAARSCRWYRAREEDVRLCINERFNLPVYVENHGKLILRIGKMTPTNEPVDPTALVSRCLRKGYRFVDADEDISPGTD